MSRDRKTKARFTPSSPKPMTPHDRTNAAARIIIESEAKLRAEKTARLRAIRLGHEDPEDPQED